MCNAACINFVASNLSADEVKGKSVLEVGALDINGSSRSAILPLQPSSYTGIDIEKGPGVDLVCDITRLESEFGTNCFDIVICTEVMEHVLDWQAGIHNLKSVLRPNGIIILTTRSKGFKYHGYPADYWRYEEPDIRAIFSDMRIEKLEPDPMKPGVFARVLKPEGFKEADLSGMSLYSMICKKRLLRPGKLRMNIFFICKNIRLSLKNFGRIFRHR